MGRAAPGDAGAAPLGALEGAAREPAAGYAATLDAIARAGLWRELRTIRRLDGCRVDVDGHAAVSFASCDYLGLATDPRLAAAARRAALDDGTSSGSARLLTGHSHAVEQLEQELAGTFGAQAALVYGAGYLANVGLVTSLAGKDDLIVSDRLSHASSVDASRLSRATVRVARHGDPGHVVELLADRERFGRALVLVQGVYSMDGDVAPLAELVDVADERDALVVVDDAHGLGTVGPGGRGSAAAHGVADRVAAQIGNLGKALGSYGAFVLVGETLRELLVQTSRAFVFTCALPPTVLAAARAGLEVVREEPERTARLQGLARTLRRELRSRGIDVPEGDAPIVPVVVGSGDEALALSHRLLDRGWLAPAVRPPTVPEGSSRLRLTVSALHTEQQCADLARDLAEVRDA